MSDRAPMVVIGLGNPLRRDDGVGPEVIDQLAQHPLPVAIRRGCDFVVTDGEPTRLLEAWRGRTRAIVVDTIVADATPGTIHRLELGVDTMPASAPTTSSHEPGIVSAIELARVLDALPRELVVYGIEPADTEHGRGLSGPVETSVPALIERLIADIAQSS